MKWFLTCTQGSEKIQEAYYIFQDLADKYVSTPLLLNGMACAQMLMENFEEAEGFLNESLSKVRELHAHRADTL